MEGKSASIKSISECIQPELHAMLVLAENSIEVDFGAGFGIACHCMAPGREGLESWTVPRIKPICAGLKGLVCRDASALRPVGMVWITAFPLSLLES